MTKPLVSVVITCRGTAQTIRATMESLLAQSCENWEVVAVDGGVAPEAFDALALLARGEPRIRLVRDSSVQHTPAARNAGARIARGDWVGFLDTGDRLLPHSLSVRLEVARRSAVAVVHSDGYTVVDGTTAAMGLPPLAGWVYPELLQEQGPPFPSLLIQNIALAGCGYLDDRLHYLQDWDLSIRLGRKHQFGFEVVPTFVREQHGGGLTSGQVAARSAEYARVIRKHWLPMLQHGGGELLERHYRAAGDWVEHEGKRTSARRSRAIALLCRRADARRFAGSIRRLWSRPRHVAKPAFVQRSQLESAEVSIRLSELLGTPVQRLTSEFSQGQSGVVHTVRFHDGSERPRTLVLKKVDNDFQYQFHRQILEPLALDAPKAYGHVETTTGCFLVLDHIRHEPARWTDHDKFRTAARWLAKKDTVIHQHFETVQGTGLLKFDPTHPPLVNSIDDCIQSIRKGVQLNASPLLSPRLLDSLVQRQPLLHHMAADIFRNSRLTVCHRDFHLQNVLFTLDSADPVYVIDWSNPEVDSVCIDLARFVLLAPASIRSELVDIYRSSIDFEGFDRIYQQAELIMSLVQFAWTFSAILEGRREPFTPAEVRKARSLERTIVERLGLGLA